MQKARVLLAGLIVTFLALAPAAEADWLYTFDGPLLFNPSPWHQRALVGVYTVEDRVTGSFLVDESFVQIPYHPNVVETFDYRAGILAYSFTDGHQTLTEANSVAMFTELTSARWEDGQMLGEWAILITTLGCSPWNTCDGWISMAAWGDSGVSVQLGASSAANHQHLGSAGWSVERVASVPEPSTLALSVVGLIALSAVLLRRLVQRVPEPATLVLVIAGVAVLAGTRKGRWI